MWVKRQELESLKKEVADLRCKIGSLESYMYVYADDHNSNYARTWQNSVSLREIVYALAKQAKIKIRVTSGYGAMAHVLPESENDERA